MLSGASQPRSFELLRSVNVLDERFGPTSFLAWRCATTQLQEVPRSCRAPPLRLWALYRRHITICTYRSYTSCNPSLTYPPRPCSCSSTRTPSRTSYASTCRPASAYPFTPARRWRLRPLRVPLRHAADQERVEKTKRRPFTCNTSSARMAGEALSAGHLASVSYPGARFESNLIIYGHAVITGLEVQVDFLVLI
jgi:hypothetical protein